MSQKKKRKRLVGFCKQCRKETTHKYKKGFFPCASGKNRGQYEFDDWHECSVCGNKIGEDDESLRYV